MSQNTKLNTENSAYQKLAFKEFLNVSLWSIKILYKVNPSYTSAYITLSILRSLRQLAQTYILAKIIDIIIQISQQENAQLANLYPYFGLLVLVNLLSSIIGTLNSYFSGSLRTMGWSKLKQMLYLKMASLDMQTLDNPETNNKIHRANDALYRTVDYFRDVVALCSNSISLIATSIILFSTLPILIPLIIVFSIPGFITDKKYRSLMWRLGIETTEDSRKAYKSAGDLSHAPTLQKILIGNAVDYLDAKFMTFINWYIKQNLAIRKKWHLFGAFLGFLEDIGGYLGYFLVFTRVVLRKITVGDVYFQLRLIDKLGNDLRSVLGDLSNLFEFSIQIKDTYNLFQLESTFENGTIQLDKLAHGPEILLDNICFTYPETKNNVLKNINLKVNPGEKVAIVGHNGAGKTTLVKLLCRMYQTTSGNILINGHNIKDLENTSWHDNIGVLFQEFNYYSQLTVTENIAIGDPMRQPNKEAIITAAKSADALEFIEQFPNKFDQILDPKYKCGIRPSSGQWQKLALARLFYRNAPLIIFDEPTASIDAVSEYNIFNEIYRFFENKTVIIISHRFSTVRNADRIIVLEHGQIIEEGSHLELMEKNGYYAKSFKLQAAGYTK